MRLINCQVQNVRVHSDLSVDFSPSITLIGGDNETGKSSLIEAMHRALFLKATATGAPISALRSKIHLGHPTVHIRFEARGETYKLQKRFTGPSGQFNLLNESNGNQLSGAVAEEKLADLLGVKESLGSRQVGTILPTRWAHLWVMQGSAGNDLFKQDKNYYDFDSLLLQLEEKGGAAIQQSVQDQLVVNLIDQEIELNFTSRGVKKNSELWRRQEELDNAEQKLNMSLSTLREYENATEELAKIVEKIEQIQNIELPDLLEQKRLILLDADKRKQLERAISLTEKELDPIKLKYNFLKKDLLNINKLSEEIRVKEKLLATLQSSQNEQKALELTLINELKTKQEVHETLKVKKQKMDQRRNLLQLLTEQFRIKDLITSLKINLNKSKKNLENRKELEKQIVSLSKINRAELQHLRELNQKLRDTSTRKDAMSTGIKVIQSNQVITLNGEELKEGIQKQLGERFVLKVGDDVLLQISPGGSDKLSDLNFKCQKQQEDLTAVLRSLGLESVRLAEQHFEKRVTLELQLSGLEESTQEYVQSKQKELEMYELKYSDLKHQLLFFDSNLKELSKEETIPNSSTGFGDLNVKINQDFNLISKAFENAESDLQLAQKNLQQFKDSYIKDESNIKVIDSQLNVLRQNIANLDNEHENFELLNNQVNSLQIQIKELEVRLDTQKNKLKSLDEIDSQEKLLKIESEIQSLEIYREKLVSDKGAARRTCENISSSNPFENVEKAKVHLETARVDYETLKRLTDSHKLLQELFCDVQADLSSKYTEPLAKSVSNFLKPLIPFGPLVQLNFDQVKGFSSLKMRRGKEFYDFDQLSGGMREQLTAALRLSMADVLKSEHDGCLPLVFDDAFTNSDPKRVDIVKKMIKSAVEKGLQIILLTCDPNAYENFADKKILLKPIINS